MDAIIGIVELIKNIHIKFDDDVVAICDKILSWLK